MIDKHPQYFSYSAAPALVDRSKSYSKLDGHNSLCTHSLRHWEFLQLQGFLGLFVAEPDEEETLQSTVLK